MVAANRPSNRTGSRHADVVPTGTAKLTREDWERGAFEAFSANGLDAVAVEPIARRLGVSKGSFYWHFSGRDDLVAAVLRRWLDRTEAIIAQAQALPDPRARLEAIFGSVYTDPHWQPLEVDLHAHVSHPEVARAVGQAAHRRLTFMAQCLREIGLAPEDAADGALQAYALWTGLLHLGATTPEVIPTGPASERFRSATLDLMQTLYTRAGPPA